MNSGGPTDLTRRGFLTLSGAAAALGALSQLRALPAGAGFAAGHAQGRFFAEREADVLAQVVERMVETGEAEAPAVRRTDTLDTIDRLCGALDPALTAPLPALLRLVEYGPILFDWTPRRFTRLAPAEKDQALYGWMTSRFALRRLGFLALRNLSFLGYYSQPETWPLIGYAGPLLPGTGPS
jgi:hypothetical protein